jgi:hypothetical protein
MSTYKHTSTVILSTVVTAALLAGAGCAANRTTTVDTAADVGTEGSAMTQPANTPPVNDTPGANINVNVDVTATVHKVVTGSVYKDGTYTAVGEYKSPAGAEEIGVTVTLKNDIIVDVTVEPKATVAISKRMQADFAANYKTLVVGKNIAEVKLTKVSGSSLTPAGFNDALVKIMAQAKI